MDPATRNFLLLKLAETLGVIAVMMIASTSSGLVYRPVDFKYPRREGRVSVTVYLLILAAAVFIFLSTIDFSPLEKALAPLGKQVIVSALALGIAAVALLYRRQPLLSAGWGRAPNLRLGLRIGIMLVFLTIFLRGKVMAIINGVSGEEGILLLLILGISLAEETVFRGYLQLRMNAWLSKPNGWLLTAGLFVIWQLPRLLTGQPDLWLNLVVLVVQSFLLGWLMQKTGHVLAPALYRTFSEWITYLS